MKLLDDSLKFKQLAAFFYSLITVFFIGFILAASLVQGQHKPLDLKFNASAFTWPVHQSLGASLSKHDLRDITTNVLLYIPLGLFLSLCLSCHRARLFTPWIFLGTVVSYLVETMQRNIGGRFPDVVDLLTNSGGFLTGFVLAYVAVRFLRLDPMRLMGFDSAQPEGSQANTLAALRFLYISIYIIVALAPFEVSVSFSKIIEKLSINSEGRLGIILDPFYHFRLGQGEWGRLTLEWLGLVPVALLSALIAGWKRRLNLLTPVFSTFYLVIFSEVAQLFIPSRTSDIIQIPLGLMAGLLGWSVAKIWFRLVQPDRQMDESQGNPLWGFSLMAYGFFVVMMAWVPFEFEEDSRKIIHKLIYESNLIPFYSHFSVRDLSSAIDLVKEAGLFIPMGILVAGWIRHVWASPRKVIVITVAGAACLFFAMFVELSQSFCVGRYTDMTDVFLAGLGGVAGAVVTQI